MIIFFNKKTGDIVGTIDGRIHRQDHLNMWIGDNEETERLIVDWKPVKWFDMNGNQIPEDCLDACDENGRKLACVADFEPNHPQKELFVDIEKRISHINEFKLDVSSKRLIFK